MKSLIKLAAVAVVVLTPALSFAQGNQAVTRAQVRSQLVQLEQSGFQPADGYRHPEVAAHAYQALAEESTGSTAFGSVDAGSARSGN